MPDTRAPTVPQFTRRLGIETPEHLVLELELAGLGSRMAATVCDAGLIVLAFVLMGLAIQLLPTPTGGDAVGPWSTLAAIVLIVTVFLLVWGYFLLFEAFNDGRTPGKRLMGIRVVMDTGHPLTFTAAERFVMPKREGWETFRALAARAERLGLKQLGAAEIPGFAAQYREVASDLARARTYGVDPRVLEYLERVVSAGHNALYGRHTGQRVPIVRLALRELPAAVVEARAFVLAALLLFALPAVTGYLAIRERPAIAEEVLPDEMIARARAGAGRRAEGVGYAEAPSMYLPVVASRIITNNVQVAFFAFAFGITAGVGTLLLLTLNGLFFGAVLGLFANYGLAGWLLTFVAGHGVLELTAIFIAGGAGLLVARALVAPGDLTRRDAIVLAGRHGVRMVGAAVAQ